MESVALQASLLGGQLVGGAHVPLQASAHTHCLVPTFCGSRRDNISFHKKRSHLKKRSHVHPKPKGFQPVRGNRSKIIMDKDMSLDRNEETVSSNGSISVVPDAIYSVKNDGSNSFVPNGARSMQTVESSYSNSESVIGYFPLNENQLAILDERDKMPRGHLQDLLFMIRTAERNIRLLHEAHICAIGDREKMHREKEVLQEKVHLLEMKMAETDARLKLAEQEKVRAEMSNGYKIEDVQDISNNLAASQAEVVKCLSEELSVLRSENISLKDEIQVLKDEIGNLQKADERLEVLEKEQTIVESSLEELELELAGSRKDSSKVSSLELECKYLHEKVEYLQGELAKVTKPDEQTAQLLEQNEELCERVEQLVEFLNDAKKIEKQHELMQHRIRALDEFLQKSDEEIHSQIVEYKDSVTEFQNALSLLKKENKNRENMETSPSLHELPWEFWSRLLLIVDGWFLEKKISVEEANSLRDMIWNRKKSVSDAYMSSMEKKDDEMISSFRKLISSTTRRLHIIHIAAEMAPVAKVGGLGDVVTGLSKALQEKGHLVEVILPKYDCINHEIIKDLKALELPVDSYFDGKIFQNKIWVGIVEGLPVYLIEPHHPDKFFWRGQVYGEHDDFRRFSFFSRAALELLLQAGKKPDIIHCHDWQTAFVAPLYWDLYVHRGLNSARICFTFHNIEYQGSTPASALASCGLDVNHLNRPDRMQDNFVIDRVNPVKGAIVFSNIVTTVSPSYAKEVLTPEGGRGLQSTLNLYSRKFVGILNGIDTDAWNPATDPFLKVHYDSNDIGGKAVNKAELRRCLGLSSANTRQPLVACITRLVTQKGTHLIRYAIFRTLELGGQFVLLGSSPVPSIQREFEELSNQLKSDEHARLVLKYDESLAHLIFAASDMYIIPSLFEPCGLTQMIGMRYGAIPIARKTGGLGDSVFDVHDDETPVLYRNGFTFCSADEKGLNHAMERAFDLYNNDTDNWNQLVEKVMNIDFSWGSSAIQYEELYRSSVARGKAANLSIS